jgi:hypothetical protein
MIENEIQIPDLPDRFATFLNNKIKYILEGVSLGKMYTAALEE